jgi:hypothetical protein
MSTADIKEATVMQNLLYLTETAKTYISNSKRYSDGNFLYTSANSAFLGLVYLNTAQEIIENPSILNKDSTVFDLKLEDIEEQLENTEQRSNNCSLDCLEWCVGARQRIIWAKNQLISINNNNYLDLVSKIIDYSYVVAWTDIANTFLEFSETDSDVVFVETNNFKKQAQQYLVDIENKLTTSSVNISQDMDLQRRFNAAKTSFDQGWYVTSLYDSATVLAIIHANEEKFEDHYSAEDIYDRFNENYQKLNNEIDITESTNIWSKMFLNHAQYYYESSKYYEENQSIKQQSEIKTMYSIMLFSEYLYDVEKSVIEYYMNVNIEDLEQPKEEPKEKIINEVIPESEVVYVYEETKDERIPLTMIILSLILFCFCVILITIIKDLEKQKQITNNLLTNIENLSKKTRKTKPRKKSVKKK